MGDNSNNSEFRYPKCRKADQWFDLHYHYDDLYQTPIANMPFEVVCERDPSIKQRGTTDAQGKAHVEGLIPGSLQVHFNPDSDAPEQQKATELRTELKSTFDDIIATIQADAVTKETVWQQTGTIEKGLVYAGAFMHGVWEGATDFVEFMQQAAAILAKAGMAYMDIWHSIVTGDIKTLEKKLEQAREDGNELANDTVETFEGLFLLLSDEEVRAMLMDFPERYWDAHHSVDQVHMAGSIGSDLVVGLVIGALSGGAAAAAVAGKSIAKGGQSMAKAMGLIKDLVTQLKKIKGKLSFKGSTQTQRRYNVKPERPNHPRNSHHSGDNNKSGTNGNGDSCSPNKETCSAGEPISMITGEELLEQIDFNLPGLIALPWARFYRTSNSRNRGMGHGWTFPTCETLQISDNTIVYSEREGRQIEFPIPEIGQFSTNSAEGLFLHREWHNLFYLKQAGQPDKLFMGPTSVEKPVPGTLKLAAFVDTVGNRWDCFYNSNQLIERMESSWGDVLEFEPNVRGMIERISDGNGNTLARYHYSSEKDLIAVEDAGGDAERFQYQNHIITQRTLRTGFRFYFQWDQYTPKARCLKQWGDNGFYNYRFEWNPKERINKAIDSNGGVQEIHYNKRGLVEKEIDPEGHVTHYEYDAQGRKIKTIDAMGFEHQFHYDEVGNLSAELDSAGGGYSLLYDTENRPISFVDAEGNEWSREYNEEGLISKTIDAEGHETRYFYNAQGLPELIINPLGHKRILAWNEKGRLKTEVVVDPTSSDLAQAPEPTHYYYDDMGNVAHVQTGQQTTRYQYNPKGDITAILYPDGAQARLEYNANRQLTCYTDPLGRATRFEYDGLAQVVRRIDPAGHTLQYHYDKERNLVGLTNEKGEHYQLKYDANERLIEEIGFDGRVQQYEYNPLGHLVAHFEGIKTEDSVATTYQRDPMGRLLEKQTPEGEATRFGYNKNGQLISAINRHRSLVFEFSANGHLLAEQQDHHALLHQYNPLGHRSGSTLPDGSQLAYQYNTAGQFIALDYNGHRLTQLQRNQRGQETARSQGQLQSQFEYDPAGRLINHAVHNQNQRQTLIQRQYQYDQAGRLNQIDDLRKGSTHYHYDALDRLKAVEGYAAEQFSFDPAGNILSSQAQQNNNHNHTQGNRLRFHADRHFTYDDRGNLITEQRGKGGQLTTRYHYNSQNQLIKVEKEGQQFEYQYDALGRRIKKTDAFGETEFLWNGDVLLSEKRKHQNKHYIYEPHSFKPLAFIENNQCYFYHLDHLGTPQELTDWEGNVVWSARYRVYGNVVRKDVEQVENNIRFQGQYWDEETGLHYNRFRYYDPGTGQFTQQDPIGLLGGDNIYQYAPNPTNWSDPLGLACKEEILRRIEASKKARESSSFENHIKRDFTNPLERQLTRDQYQDMTSKTRGQGVALQNTLDDKIANQPYVYRYTTQDTVNRYYKPQGGIKRPAYTTADDLGLDARSIMDEAQVFDHWGEPDVLVRVPTSEITSAKVPRPFGNSHEVGWEPNTEAYPGAGKGGANQFLMTTDTWDDSWVIPLKTLKKGP